jgi:hypothetical protein
MTIFGACFLVLVPGAKLPLEVKVHGNKILVAVLFCCEIGDELVTIKPSKKYVHRTPLLIPTNAIAKIVCPYERQVFWSNPQLPV